MSANRHSRNERHAGYDQRRRGGAPAALCRAADAGQLVPAGVQRGGFHHCGAVHRQGCPGGRGHCGPGDEPGYSGNYRCLPGGRGADERVLWRKGRRKPAPGTGHHRAFWHGGMHSGGIAGGIIHPGDSAGLCGSAGDFCNHGHLSAYYLFGGTVHLLLQCVGGGVQKCGRCPNAAALFDGIGHFERSAGPDLYRRAGLWHCMLRHDNGDCRSVQRRVGRVVAVDQNAGTLPPAGPVAR